MRRLWTVFEAEAVGNARIKIPPFPFTGFGAPGRAGVFSLFVPNGFTCDRMNSKARQKGPAGRIDWIA